jgi:hypothetical protein
MQTFKSISLYVLKCFSTLETFGTDGRLNRVALFAFYNQLAPTILAVVTEECGFSAFGTVDG